MDNITQSDIKACLNKSPEEIVDFFKAKGCRITWDWQDDWQECQAKSFTVAKVMEMDILQDIKNELVRALDSGETLQTFKSNLESVLAAKGWWKGKKEVTNPDTGDTAEIELGSNRRMKQIFKTNLTTSYRAGQYKQQWESRESRPWWMYVCKMLPTSREEHKALHGKVFRYDDPFWDSFYPPNGFNCRCDVIPLTEDEINKIEHYTLQPKLDKDGQPVVVNGIPQYERVLTKIEKCKSTPTTLTQRNAQVTIDNRKMTYKQAFYQDGTMMNAVSTDRGWNYNPGKAVYFEPDLTKYDKQFVDAYLKMKAEFDGNMLLRKTYLRGDYASEAAINDALTAIAEHYLFPKNMFAGTELATNYEIVSTKYTNPKVKGQFADKKIHISETIVLDLKSAWQKIQLELQGIKQEFTYSEAKALNVYIHELIHSQTPTNKILDINERVLREGLTEMLSRQKTNKFTRIVVDSASYDGLVSVLKNRTNGLSEKQIKDCLNSNNFCDNFFELINIKEKEKQIEILKELRDCFVNPQNS